jgi:2'-5' RNA ligase
MKRLFFALWPDAATRQLCQQITNSLSKHGSPVNAMNFHVTLAFLGQVDSQQQIALTQAASRIQFTAMKLSFNRLSYWKKPGIVCLSTDHPDPATSDLAEQLAQIGRLNGLQMDERPFQPHVTLLRKAHSLPRLDFEPIHWQAKRFCLVESYSKPAGVEYRVLEQWRHDANAS